MPPFRHTIHQLGGALLNFVYPPLCAGCKRWLPAPTDVVCQQCIAGLERANLEAVAATLATWPAAIQTLDGVFCLWKYGKKGTARDLQHQLKYQNRPWLGHTLGRHLGQGFQTFSTSAGWPAPDVIIPVPLSNVRRYERGYNQSQYLAEGMAEVLACPIQAGWMIRPRATRSQARLTKTERQDNVVGAFAIPNPDNVQGRHILIVDDVLTTGATALAAARPLHEAGASTIYLATFAFASASM